MTSTNTLPLTEYQATAQAQHKANAYARPYYVVYNNRTYSWGVVDVALYKLSDGARKKMVRPSKGKA